MLALVHGGLEQIVEVLPLHEVGGARAIGKEQGKRFTRDAIALIFKAMNCEPVGGEIGKTFQARDRLL